MVWRNRLIAALERLTGWLGGNPSNATSVLASLPEPAFAIDLQGRVICWNAAMERLTGVSASAMMGQGDYAYAVPIYGTRRPLLVDLCNLPESECRALYPNVRIVGGSWFAQVETQHLQGRYGFLSAMASPLLDAQGRRIGAVEQIRDDTELHQSEEQVRMLSTAVAQSPNGTVITDAKGTIEYVNAAFVQMYGYSADEVIGQNMRLLSSGHTAPEAIRGMWTALQSGRNWKGEFVNRRKDGNVRNIFCRVSPIRQSDGVVTRYLAIQEDMTERKQIGQELDRYRHHLSELVVERTSELAGLKESAEAASEAKSAFLANMSHEIRTPMNGIIGLTRIVRLQATDPKMQRTLDKVLVAAQSLLHIINDILDISKIEANKVSLEAADFYLPQVVQRQVDMVAQQAASKGLAVQVEMSNQLASPVRGDSLRLGQILLNLLSNAVKFTQQGQVTVRAQWLEKVSLPDGSDGCRLRFEVEDTGVGVPTEVQHRLFHNFEQADTSTTRRYGGTGLGLAICRRLVEMMGGVIGVRSEPDHGACFWFEVALGCSAGSTVIPEAEVLSVAVDAHEALQQQLAQCHAGAKLLLVEDNEINQEVALEMLSETGLQVAVANDGAQAVAMAGQTQYDMILMDIQMPVMDGLTAARQIRLLPGYRQTPIVAMTANVFEEDQKACVEAGMSAHLPKPVSPASLYGALQHWLTLGKLPVTPDVPASAPEDDPLDFLKTLPGVDVQQGLDSLRGRVPSYVRMLRKFAETQADDSAALLSALQGLHQPAQREEARRLAHSLKGVAGTLGLLGLQQQAGSLELLLKGDAEESVVLPVAAEVARMRQALANQLLSGLVA